MSMFSDNHPSTAGRQGSDRAGRRRGNGSNNRSRGTKQQSNNRRSARNQQQGGGRRRRVKRNAQTNTQRYWPQKTLIYSFPSASYCKYMKLYHK